MRRRSSDDTTSPLRWGMLRGKGFAQSLLCGVASHLLHLCTQSLFSSLLCCSGGRGRGGRRQVCSATAWRSTISLQCRSGVGKVGRSEIYTGGNSYILCLPGMAGQPHCDPGFLLRLRAWRPREVRAFRDLLCYLRQPPSPVQELFHFCRFSLGCIVNSLNCSPHSGGFSIPLDNSRSYNL